MLSADPPMVSLSASVAVTPSGAVPLTNELAPALCVQYARSVLLVRLCELPCENQFDSSTAAPPAVGIRLRWPVRE